MKKSLVLFAALILTLLSLSKPALTGGDSYTYLPYIYRPPSNLTVDPQSRDASRNFYYGVYLPSEGASPDWTGSHAGCDPGSTAQSFRDAILLRINYFRAMAGLPPLEGLDDTYNQKAQQAALMMSANNQLSHTPTPDWDCYTADGDEAAGSANLYLGVYGVSAIDGYVYDPGDGNYALGHRRWILYPQTRFMGTGDIPPTAGHPPANALWVFDEHTWDDRPATREPFVAWPPPGYVPYHVVFPRWSLSYPGADFTAATVIMTRNGAPLSVDVRPVVTGYGENTLVWEPGADFNTFPGPDITFTVDVDNVLVDGGSQSFVYSVIIFDPDTLSEAGAAPVGMFGELGQAPVWQ